MAGERRGMRRDEHLIHHHGLHIIPPAFSTNPTSVPTTMQRKAAQSSPLQPISAIHAPHTSPGWGGVEAERGLAESSAAQPWQQPANHRRGRAIRLR